jgi:SAM-dependent methyltransferase
MLSARPIDEHPEHWRAWIDEALEARGLPGIDDAARLGACVRALSQAYNREGHGRAVEARTSMAARLGFFLPRDLPKTAAALSEVAVAHPPGARVLDLGAGMGAATFGAAYAMRLVGGRVGPVVGVDVDGAALRVFAELAGRSGIAVETRCSRLGPAVLRAGERFDLVLAQDVGTELGSLDVLVEIAGRALVPGGVLALVEPALSARARSLQHLRGRMIDGGWQIVAPCTHARPCPLLSRDRDWCHQDVDVDLPAWLHPVARAAGLRWQGLTFSFLVARRGSHAGDPAAARSPPLARVVDRPRKTRGKLELRLCGALQPGAWVRRLDRHASAGNAAWDHLARGARLEDPGAEVGADTVVRRAD